MPAPHVVFVVGEDEYRSEHTLPAFAAGLQQLTGLRCTSLTPYPDPRDPTNIPGLEALDRADLAVFYLRWRELPDDQMRRIVRYVQSGKPELAAVASEPAVRPIGRIVDCVSHLTQTRQIEHALPVTRELEPAQVEPRVA